MIFEEKATKGELYVLFKKYRQEEDNIYVLNQLSEISQVYLLYDAGSN